MAGVPLSSPTKRLMFVAPTSTSFASSAVPTSPSAPGVVVSSTAKLPVRSATGVRSRMLSPPKRLTPAARFSVLVNPPAVMVRLTC